ncbi:MAG: GNAT family N-acetyltransferase [Sphingomonadaceae bacterium]
MSELAPAVARIVARAAEVAPALWDRLAGTASPFVAHGFISALEDSGSAVEATGWRPCHILVDGPDGAPAGILPGYLKAHSQGEYVFDHGWADAWARAGLAYYPKLQHSVPFTPATAPKLLAGDAAVRATLVAASETLVRQNALSTAHATFLPEADARAFAEAGWQERRDVQFHWLNQGFAGFDDFLGSLASRKRKTLRHEREAALAAIDEVVWLSGTDLTESTWDAFFAFYLDTGSRKWGRPYLNRRFFSLVGERMADRIVLVMARKGRRYVAGALNFLGDDALYGRHWGCIEDIPFLHFELCYHQAIDIACQRKLARVEAGAQGAHKLARGYRPIETRSMHFVADPRFHAAVADFLRRERPAVAAEARALESALPYRREPRGEQGLE